MPDRPLDDKVDVYDRYLLKRGNKDLEAMCEIVEAWDRDDKATAVKIYIERLRARERERAR